MEFFVDTGTGRDNMPPERSYRGFAGDVGLVQREAGSEPLVKDDSDSIELHGGGYAATERDANRVSVSLPCIPIAAAGSCLHTARSAALGI
jgi:hypothetical protein